LFGFSVWLIEVVNVFSAPNVFSADVVETNFKTEAGARTTSGSLENRVSLLFGSINKIPGRLRAGASEREIKFAGSISP
jgi:hypothetical protein